MGQADHKTEPETARAWLALPHSQEIPQDDKLRDIVIITQYQRMMHYGLAGFGTAAAYTRALGKTEDDAKLKQAVSEIYKGDEYASKLAESLQQVAAK